MLLPPHLLTTSCRLHKRLGTRCSRTIAGCIFFCHNTILVGTSPTLTRHNTTCGAFDFIHFCHRWKRWETFRIIHSRVLYCCCYIDTQVLWIQSNYPVVMLMSISAVNCRKWLHRFFSWTCGRLWEWILPVLKVLKTIGCKEMKDGKTKTGSGCQNTPGQNPSNCLWLWLLAW